ncbi:hypothetical protein ACFHW1_11980 [Micromonospora sp. LOL_014]|uniref:hypothetical protein n=1 Tax=Micromonospora sp. LOL_014 TaxID=3345415 RepID=UPI003A8C30A7
MDESRFRRDFLGQWINSPDPGHAVRLARSDAANASTRLLGAPIWKALDAEVEAEFNSMIGPLSEDPAALGPVLLLLTKVLVDGIDPQPLKNWLGSFEANEKSLRLLQRFVEQLGGSSDATSILRALYGFRSSGGVAHLTSPRSRERAASALEISDMSNTEAFTSVATRVTECLNIITSLISGRLAESTE